MAEQFSNLGKQTEIQIQGAQRVPRKMNPQQPNLIIKFSEAKARERILEAAREKMTCYLQGKPLKTSTEFSAKSAGLKRVAGYIQSAERKENANEYFTQQRCSSDLNERVFQTSKS